MEEKNGGYSVKGVKTFNGMEGRGFNATLYKDGKKVAEAIDDASGGPLMLDYVSKEAEAAHAAFCATLPPLKSQYFPEGLKMDAALHVEELVNDYESERWLKRHCAKETLFSLPGDAEGNWRTVKAPYDARVKAFILGKYPNATIVNERFSKVSA